jgi:hypothetical protein
LAGTNFGNQGSWYWFNGLEGSEELSFTNWESDEPGIPGFDCMTQYEDGFWHTRPCGEKMRPLCQKLEKTYSAVSL